MREKPPPAPAPSGGLSRRTFIQIGTAVGTVAALTSLGPPTPPAAASAMVLPAAPTAAERPHRTLLGVL
jgi:hypothetical protein